MRPAAEPVIYWDSSGVLSALFRDAHSDAAYAWVRRDAIHLLSSLSLAEVHAVISRIRRERKLADVLLDAALEALETGPWRRIHMVPAERWLRPLAESWPLRGADLWHLALARTMQQDLPELALLTFDTRLAVAARGEGLICPLPNEHPTT